MTTPSYGAQSRRPVYSGTRRIPGLYERTLADGSTVYEAALRLGGKVRRHRLEARTKTDAIAELRSAAGRLRPRRGSTARPPRPSPSPSSRADYLAHLRARVGDTRSAATPLAAHRRALPTSSYGYTSCRCSGTGPPPSLTVADVRRLLDTLAAKRLAPRSRQRAPRHPRAACSATACGRASSSGTSCATSTATTAPGRSARPSRAT